MHLKKGRRALRYVFWSAIGLVLLALGVMSTPWFQRALERHIIAGIEQFTGGRVEVAAMRFHPLIFRVVFRGFVLHGSEAPADPPLFSARLVVAGLDPTVLLHRRLHLRALVCDDAEVHLRTKPDGSTNIPGPRLSFENGEALESFLDLSVGRVTVARTSLYWNDQRLPLNLDAKDLALLVHLTPDHHYEGSLAGTTTLLKLPKISLPPVTFATRFGLQRGKVTLSALNWRGKGFEGQCAFTYSFAPSAAGALSFQATSNIPLLAKALDIPALRGGSLRAEGHAAYHEGGYSAQGKVEVRDLAVQAPQFRAGHLRIAMNYQATPRQMEFTNLAISALGGEARGRAQVALHNAVPHVTLELGFHGIDWASALNAFPNTPAILARMRLASRLEGTSHASWVGRCEQMDAAFQTQFLAPANNAAASIPLEGHVGGRFSNAHGLHLHLEEARFSTPRSTLSARGELGFAGMSPPPARLSFQISTTDLKEWQPLAGFLWESGEPPSLALKAPLRFAGELAGPLSAPEISGRLETGEFEIHGWTWDSFIANAAFGPGIAKISEGHLRSGNSSLILETSASLRDWQLVPDSSVHFSARARRTPLAGLMVALGAKSPIMGNVSGGIELAGHPSDLEGAGDARIDSGTIAGEPFDLLTTKVRVTNSVWDFDPIEMQKGQGRIQGQVRFAPTTRLFSSEFHAQGLSLADVHHLAAFQSHGSTAGLEGRAGFDLGAQGTPEKYQFHIAWNLVDVSLAGIPLGDLKGQIDSEAGHLQVAGDAQGPAGTLHFSGTGQVASGGPVKLEGQYVNVRLDPWIRYSLRGKFSAQVLTSGSFQLSGPLAHPAQIALTSQAQILKVNFPSIQWKNDEPVEIRLAEGILTAQRFHMRGPSTDIEIEGSANLASQSGLALTARGNADATLLSLLDPAVMATGQSELNIKVGGSLTRPLLHGLVVVTDVGLSYGNLPFRISGLNGEIQLEGEQANLHSLRGVSGGGSVTLGGSITFSTPLRFEVRTELEQVRLRYPTDFTSVLNGRLRLVGTEERGQLLGELVVRQMFANENINWLARIAEAGHPFEEQTPGVTSPLASKIRLGIRVTSVPPVRLETGDLRLVADIDMRIQGTLANPVQVGTIRALRGEGVFRGNRYTLVRGDLNFTNPARTLAYMDLEAQTRVQQYNLTLDIAGPFDHLKFSYRSDPPLPTADILSLLTLGYSQQQEEMSTVTGHPLPSVGASAILSQALSSQVTGRIQRLFGVSRIKIEPNVGLPGFTSGAQVTVEEQITHDLTLTYITNTAASQYSIIQFEWALSDRVSVLGVRDPNGIFGLEFRFRNRFR